MTTASPLAARLGQGTGMFAPTNEGDAAVPAFRTGASESRSVSNSDPASEAQLNFIRVLLGERVGNVEAEGVRVKLNRWRESGGINKVAASATITELKAIPKNQGEAQIEAPTGAPRRNQYGKKCDLCTRFVPADEGLLSKSDDGGWVVTHEACPSDFPFPEGRYAVDNDDGDLRFYHLTEGMVYVMASDNLHPIHGKAADAIVAKIAVDPEGASRRFGRESRKCGLCGRRLTTLASREAGIGPVCASKGF